MKDKILEILRNNGIGQNTEKTDKLVKELLVLFDVSGISTDYERDLFTLTNKYAKAGLSKPHTVARLEWVLGSVKKS